MKPTIEELVLQIISTALTLTLQGKWHASAYLHGKVGTLDVYLHATESDVEHRHDGGYFAHPDGWAGFTPEQAQEHCLQTLTALLAWLQGFLDMPAAPAQERAE